MNDTLLWIAGGGGTFIIALVGFWTNFNNRVTEATTKTQAAEDRAKAADNLASAAVAKCQFISDALNDHRVETASKIAALQAVSETTAKSLAASEMRLAKSIEDVGDKIDKLGESVIRTLGNLAARQDKHEGR